MPTDTSRSNRCLTGGERPGIQGRPDEEDCSIGSDGPIMNFGKREEETRGSDSELGCESIRQTTY